MSSLSIPKLAVSSEQEAVSIVNLWLHREIGMAVHSTNATFNSMTFCWHLPIEVAYPTHGTLGVIGDVYLHAATGDFVGQPDAEDLGRRAERLDITLTKSILPDRKN